MSTTPLSLPAVQKFGSEPTALLRAVVAMTNTVVAMANTVFVVYGAVIENY
jgi:hypothetical protein